MTIAGETQKLPPGPPRAGTLSKLAIAYRFFTDSVGVVSERFERYGDVYYVPGSPDGLFVMRHPDHIYQVLVEKSAAFTKQHDAFERLGRVLGKGLLTADGDVWRRHRRMIQPAFQRQRLVTYCQVMADESEAVARRWRDGDVVEINKEMTALTLSIVCRTLFSHDASAQTDEVAEAMRVLQSKVTRPDLLPAWFPNPGRDKLESAVESLDRIIYRLIRQRKSQGQGHDDLLDRLLLATDEDGGQLGEDEIRDELVTLFLAGHETTAQALSWTYYLLSQHPDVAKKLRAELERVLGGRAPSYADLENLSYTEQVIDESMRLYPPVYLIARRAARDVEIGDHLIPKGSEIVMWIFLTHRDPRWFPEPLEFRPERWTPEMRAALPRAAYVPFGAGPRTCVGKMFALLEARIVLATLLQRFSAERVSDQPILPKPRVTLVPKHGMKMRLRRND